MILYAEILPSKLGASQEETNEMNAEAAETDRFLK